MYNYQYIVIDKANKWSVVKIGDLLWFSSLARTTVLQGNI